VPRRDTRAGLCRFRRRDCRGCPSGKSHQDSEKSDDMVATLVVVLPSEYSGGVLTVEHRGETKTFRRRESQAKDISLFAFFARTSLSSASERNAGRAARPAFSMTWALSRAWSDLAAPGALPRGPRATSED
jgi:hypothetical protein